MLSRSLTLTAAALAAAVGLGACGSSSQAPTAQPSSGAPTSTGGQAFPVTVEHAFGETTIEKKPERVATVAWGNHEVPLALGVVPVGMSKATWGDDDKNGIHPWVEQRLTELGGQTPVLFDDTDAIDFEAVANTKPDVILAAYSGLTKEQYDKLSQIAPVVAYPKIAWATSMDDMIAANSRALGLGAEGEKLAAGLDRQIAAAAAEHPNLKGKSAMFAAIEPTDLSKVGFYNDLDPRQQLLTQVGMTTPKAVAATDGGGQFYNTVSAEQIDTLAETDVVVSYTKDAAGSLKAAKNDPLWAKLPPVENGAVAFVTDDTPLAAVANPSPLNIPWGLGRYLQVVDSAAAKAK